MNNTDLEKEVLQVPIEDIIPNRFQPRLSFDDASLKDLASSIKQHGIIQPLVLRRKNDKYEIIAGERRYKAAKLAGLISVPAIIANMDDNTSAEVAIVENIQRKDLTAIEEAKSYQALLDKGYMTQEELAKKMGLSQSAISNKLRLLSLDESVQKAILDEKISERHARTLLRLPDKNKQKEMLDRIINERLTVKQLDDEIKKTNQNNSESQDKLVKGKPLKEDDIVTINIDVPEKVDDNMNDLFSNPTNMQNKFFNFLEDEAANMNVEETPVVQEEIKEVPKEETKPFDLLSQTDDIEMLDDFFIAPIQEQINKNTYVDEVINTIKNLNLDKEKVTIEELDLPNEYSINIKIKKDN